jgi:hypothetical protein
MYESPLFFCPHCKHYVALDQSQSECAKRQQCTVNPCPLVHLFAAGNETQERAATGKEPGVKRPLGENADIGPRDSASNTKR